MSAAPVRPRQATWAGWVILVGSVLVLLSVVQVVGAIGSLETRQGVEDFLASPPGGGLGLEVQQAIEVLRISAMVAAACAVAAAILGWQVLQRSRSARVVLSVLAAPLFLTGTITGGLLSAAVVAAIVTLWLHPTADWFAGRTPPPAPSRGPVPPVTAPPQTPTTSPYPPGQLQAPPQAAPAVGGPTPERPRPVALLWACVVAWVGCSLVLLFGVLTLVVVWGAPEEVLAALREQDQSFAEQGISLREVQVASTIILGVLAVWCVAAAVMAALALRGVAWARITLLVSASVAAVLTVLAMIAAPVLVVLLAGCGITIGLLLRPEVRQYR